MKRRMQKIFITLLALFIAGFAMANAYVFDVTNRSPFGVLNLSKLVIKDLSHTGMILDSDTYTIKIDPENEDPEGGQIRVYEICDENGGNCKKITELGGNGTGATGGTNANDGALIFYKDSTEYKRFSANTGTSVSVQLTPAGTAGGLCIKSGSDIECYKTGFVTTGQLKDGILVIKRNGVTGGVFSANTGSNVTVDIDVPVVSGSPEYICVKSGDNLECNKAKFGTMGGGSGNDGICRYQDGIINCTYNDIKGTPGSGSTGVYVYGQDSGHICTRIGENQIYCYTNPADFVYVETNQTVNGTKTFTISPVVPEKTSIATGYSTSIATEYQVWTGDMELSGRIDNLSGKIIIIAETGTSNQYCYSTDGKNLYCNKTIPSGGNGINATGLSGYRCQYQCNGGYIDVEWNCGDDTTCQTAETKYKNVVGCSNPTNDPQCVQEASSHYYENPGRFSKYINDCSIVCDQEAPSCDGECTGSGGIQVTQYSGGKYCAYMTPAALQKLKELGDGVGGRRDSMSITEGSGEIRCMFEGGGGGGVTISDGSEGSCCTYVDENTIMCKSSCGGGPKTTINIYTGGNVYNQTGDITNNYFSGGETLWTGDSATLYPMNSDDKVVYIGMDAGEYNVSGAVLAVNGATVFADPSNPGGATSVAKIDTGGVRLFGTIDFYMGQYSIGGASPVKKMYGLTVAGPIAIGYDKGNTGNFIYMYSAGGSTSTGRHYEIMGSNELAVGVLSGGFMFFRSNATAGSYNNKKYSIGINTIDPQATLDVNGTIKVSATCAVTCGEGTVGTIAYSSDHFFGCRKKSSGNGYEWTRLDNNTSGSGDTLSASSTSCLEARPRHSTGAGNIRPVDLTNTTN